MLDAEAGEQVVSAHPVPSRSTGSPFSLLLYLYLNGLVIVWALLDPLVFLRPLPLLLLFALTLAPVLLVPARALALPALLRGFPPFTITVTITTVAFAIAVSIPIFVVTVARARSPSLPVTITVAVSVAIAIAVVPAVTVTPVSVFPVAFALSSRRR